MIQSGPGDSHGTFVFGLQIKGEETKMQRVENGTHIDCRTLRLSVSLLNSEFRPTVLATRECHIY
jgi:hypothetical protein